jgi:putative peptidoglycan lipid II flippase
MAIGTLVGGVLQLVIQLPSLHAVGFRYRPVLQLADPGLRRVLLLMGPAAIGAAAVQVNVLVNNNFASYLGDGPVSWLNVAFRFMQLPIGLFGVAIALVALPLVSRQVARNDMAATRGTVADALEFALLLSLPAACGLALLGEPIIGLIYEHGRFGSFDTKQAAQALAAYACGLVAYAGVKIVAPAFYALDDARTPARVSVVSIAVNYALNYTLVRVLHFGHVGLALSTSAVATVNFLWLFALLRRRIGGVHGRRLRASGARIAAAAAVMSTAVAAADWALAAVLADTDLDRTVCYLVRVSGGLAVGVAVFAAACSVLGTGGQILAPLRDRRRRGAPEPPAT